MGKGQCWIELRYGWGKANVVVARSVKPWIATYGER